MGFGLGLTAAADGPDDSVDLVANGLGAGTDV